LELGLNDLLDPVWPNLNYTFVVHFAGSGDAQDVLAGSNRIKNDTSRATHAGLSFIVDINFRA
jgi:hypothetical protein